MPTSLRRLLFRKHNLEETIGLNMLVGIEKIKLHYWKLKNYFERASGHRVKYFLVLEIL